MTTVNIGKASITLGVELTNICRPTDRDIYTSKTCQRTNTQQTMSRDTENVAGNKMSGDTESVGGNKMSSDAESAVGNTMSRDTESVVGNTMSRDT